jgi:hypothetical protein
MEKFRQIILVPLKIVMSSMKLETCQVKDKSKNKKHLILDRLNFISEPTIKLINQTYSNIVHQLHKEILQIRNFKNWFHMKENIITGEKPKCILQNMEELTFP